MSVRILLLVLFLALIPQQASPQQADAPLSKDQVMDLVKAGMETGGLVKLIHEHGLDFDLTDDFLQALRSAGAQDPVIQALRAVRPKPLTKEQVLQLVAGGVPSERAATLVKQRGIDFLADEKYLQTLRLAGADDEVVGAVREASAAATAQLVVETSPNAEVFLDGESEGHADAQGELTLNASRAAHKLKVSLAGKKDFEQSVTFAAQQTTRIEARLNDLDGTVVIQTSPGASVFLDESGRGSADANGQLSVPNVAAGPHELRISAPGKEEYRQKITVPAGQVIEIVAGLVATPVALSPADIVSGETVEAVRTADAVRALEPLEDDKNISSLPGGVYGFTVPWIINTDAGGARLDVLGLSRSPMGTKVMELHKRATGEVSVVGYVSESDLARLQDPARVSDAEATIFFRPYLNYSIAVAIPLSRISEARFRSVERHYASDLSVSAPSAKPGSEPRVQKNKR